MRNLCTFLLSALRVFLLCIKDSHNQLPSLPLQHVNKIYSFLKLNTACLYVGVAGGGVDGGSLQYDTIQYDNFIYIHGISISLFMIIN